MKSKTDIENRLRSLRIKYAKRYISKTQARAHRNCQYNREHIPKGKYEKTKSIDVEMASKKQTTLMVIQPDYPIRLCMYGADSPSTWLGDVCDSDEIAKSCKWFKPIISAATAKDEFLKLLEDDEWVFDNYLDIVALQWVLNDRVHLMMLTWWERFKLFLFLFFFRHEKRAPQLEAAELPTDLWDK